MRRVIVAVGTLVCAWMELGIVAWVQSGGLRDRCLVLTLILFVYVVDAGSAIIYKRL